MPTEQTDRQTDGRTDGRMLTSDHYITLFAKHGQCNNFTWWRPLQISNFDDRDELQTD